MASTQRIKFTKQNVFKRLEKFKTIKNTCWLFSGSLTTKGYGQISINGVMIQVHRLSLWIYKDFDLKNKLKALHILECRNRNCWNPDHLYVGDDCDNMQDKSKAKKQGLR